MKLFYLLSLHPMFKKNWIVVLLLLCSIVGCQQNKKEIKESKQEASSPLPGYYGQWLYIKTNGTNVLPDMSRYRWQSAVNKRATPKSLINVYEYGPSNVAGRLRGIIIDHSNPSRILVGGASGGVFISENSGASWKAINDQALSPSVTWMSQNPFDAKIMYYCTGEASGNSADLMGAGIFKSVDGGKTFSQLPATNNASFQFNWSVKCSPLDTHTLYVATHSTGLWRSTDDGATFSRVYNTGTQMNDLELFPDGSVMFTLKGTGVYRSASGNLGSFSKISSINSVSTARAELAFCKNFPNVVYAAISGPDNSYSGVLKTFYKSSDGGKTFVTRTNPNGTVNFGFTWYCMTMAVKDNDSNAIFIGAVDIGSSKDGGQTWLPGSEQHSDNHVAVNSGNNMFLGSDGGLCRYTWGNFNSYTSLNNFLNVTQLYAGDVSPHEVAIMGGCQDNGTKESKNVNKSFSSVAGADGGYCFYHPNYQGIKYYSMQNGIVFRSGENISSNIPTTDQKWFIHPYQISETNGDIVVYPADRKLYFSSDAGESYKNLTTVSSGRLFCAAISSGNNPAVYSGGSSIFVAVDSADNASPKVVNLRTSMPLSIRSSFLGCIKVIPGYRDKVYLGFNNISDSGRIYMASQLFNDTPVYKNISGDLPRGLPVNWIECDPMAPERVIFAGTDYGLYITEDSGQTWIKDTRLPSTVISNIKIHKNMKDIYFFTHGRGVFKGQVNNNAYSSIDQQASHQAIAKLYPNPASETAMLQFEGHTTGHYGVYDLQGRKVLSGKIEGETNTIPVVSLSDGHYVVMYTTSSGNGKIKISVLH
jgi:photosystem II stability/assembly factor-like uncharacterized protein